LPFRAWPRKYHLKCRRGCHAGIRPNSTAMHTSQSRHFATPDPTVPCHPLQPSVATGGECRHLGASVLGHVQGDAVHFTLSHRNQPYNSPVQTSRPSLVDVHSSTLISAEPPVAPAPRHGPILVPPLFASRPRPPCSPCGRPLSRIRPPRAVLRLPRRRRGPHVHSWLCVCCACISAGRWRRFSRRVCGAESSGIGQDTRGERGEESRVEGVQRKVAEDTRWVRVRVADSSFGFNSRVLRGVIGLQNHGLIDC
jgi:hypothetical protein